MRITPLVTWMAVSLSTGIAFAELTLEDNAARLKQIDRNGDGVLEPDEVDLGIWYRATGGKIDLLMPPSKEQVALAAANNPIFQLLRDEFVKDHGTASSYAFNEVKADVEFRLPKAPQTGGANPKPSPSPGGGKPTPGKPASDGLQPAFLLRRSLNKIPLVLDDDKSAASMSQGADKLASEGALFSYAHAFNTGADEWLAQGALAYEKPFEGGLFGKDSIGRYLFSMEFSRINFAGNGIPKTASSRFQNEDNVLNFGATYEGLLDWPQQWGGFTGSSLRFNALYKTDWALQSKIPTAEAEWKPYNGRLGFGSFNTKTSDYLWFRFDPTLHGDFGYVVADGKWTKSVKGDTFAHIGPRIGLAIIPFPKSLLFENNPLVISASFGEFGGITQQAREVRAFTSDISWYLRKPGSGAIGPIDPGIALTLSYRNYRNVENQTDDSSLILGMAVGF